MGCRIATSVLLSAVCCISLARGADDFEGPVLGAPTEFPPVGATLQPPRFETGDSADTIVITTPPQSPIDAQPSNVQPSNVPAGPDWTPDCDGNFFVCAAETLLNRLAGKEMVVEQPVRDFIMGADVYGQQMTTTRIQINLRPCRQGALAELQLEGLTQSRTVGYTPQASVLTTGRFKFCATKDVFFNGERFWTRPARITVFPSNQPLEAQTKISGVPLLGCLADRYALRVAEKRRPEAEAIGSQKLSSRVIPEFNSAVEKGLGEASYKLETDLRKKLRELNALPTTERMWTTDTHVFYGAFHASPNDPTGNPPPRRAFPAAKAVSVYLHESVINNFVDRLRLEGRSMTEPEFARILRNLFTAFKLPGMPDLPSVPDAEDDEEKEVRLTIINFDTKDPIRFRIEENQLVLLVRAGFVAPGHEPVPVQLLTIPIEIAEEGEQLYLNPGRVTVTAPEGSDGQSSKWGEIVRNRIIIRSRIGKRVPQMRFNRQIPSGPGTGNGLQLRLARFEAGGGWVAVVFE